MANDEKNLRHRFTVPAADTKVNEWIEAQSNLGFSLRTLIKAFIRDYGCQDATCLEFGVEVKKRGRPPKQARIQLGQMLDDGTSLDDQDMESDNEEVDIGETYQSVQSRDLPLVENVQTTVQPKAQIQSKHEDPDDDDFVDPMSLLQ